MFKTALGLIIVGILVGDGLGLLGLAWVSFRDRKKSRFSLFLSILFFALTVFMLLWVSAAAEIPAEAKSLAYRRGILAALIALAIGVWPAVLHIMFGWWRKVEIR